MQILRPLQPSFLEKIISLPHVTTRIGSYRLLLFILTFIFWSVNVVLSFYFPIKSSKKRLMQFMMISGIIFSSVHIFIESYAEEALFYPLTTLSFLIYIFRMDCWRSILSESFHHETHIPKIPIVWISAINLFLRICFTFGLLVEFHFLFQSIAFVVIGTAAIARSYLTFTTAPDFRNVLPCIILISCMCLTFGRQIIPERELCETILSFYLVCLPYLHERPDLGKPLTHTLSLDGEELEDLEFNETQLDDAHSIMETSRRNDPAYQRKMTVLRLFYLLQDASGNASPPSQAAA